MDEWKALAATLTAILTAGGVAIKIWGGKGGPKIEELNEQVDRKTADLSDRIEKDSKEYKEQSEEVDRRVKQLERDHDQLKSTVHAIKENFAKLDDNTREQYGTLIHEISRLENELSVSLRGISENVGFLKGRMENVG